MPASTVVVNLISYILVYCYTRSKLMHASCLAIFNLPMHLAITIAAVSLIAIASYLPFLICYFSPLAP